MKNWPKPLILFSNRVDNLQIEYDIDREVKVSTRPYVVLRATETFRKITQVH